MEGGGKLMVDYYGLEDLSNDSNIGNLLAIPNGVYPYFWAWILFGLFVIGSLSMFFAERLRKGTGNLLSSMAISAFFIIILAVLGTVVGFITNQIMVYTLVIGILIIGIWFFSN